MIQRVLNVIKPTVKNFSILKNSLNSLSTKCSYIFKPKGTGISGEIFQPIKAPELTSLRQIQKFNKDVFGVNVFDIQDIEYGKWLTEGLTEFYNKMSGNFKIHKNIILCDLPNPNGYMFCEYTKDILAISKKHVLRFKEIAIKNGETLEDTLKKWGEIPLDGTCTSQIKRGTYFELFHELGHKAHFSNCKKCGEISLDWSKQEIQTIAAKVSSNAKKSQQEFVADVFAIMIVQGHELPEDVIQLYLKCNGPRRTIENLLSDASEYLNSLGHTETSLDHLLAIV